VRTAGPSNVGDVGITGSGGFALRGGRTKS